jgi:hypothetical protein
MPDKEPERLDQEYTDILASKLPAYNRLIQEYRETCRGIRKRHRGEAREAMLRQEEEAFREKVRALLEEMKPKSQ